MAKGTEFALASYLYGSDIACIQRVSQRLGYGMVGINECIIGRPSTA